MLSSLMLLACFLLVFLKGLSDDVECFDFFYSDGPFTVEYFNLSHRTLAYMDDVAIDNVPSLQIDVDYSSRFTTTRRVEVGSVLVLHRRTFFRIIPDPVKLVYVTAGKANRKRSRELPRSLSSADRFDDCIRLQSLFPGCALDIMSPQPALSRARSDVALAEQTGHILNFWKTLKSRRTLNNIRDIEEERSRFLSAVPPEQLVFFRCSFWTLLDMLTVILLWRSEVETWIQDENNFAQPFYGALSWLFRQEQVPLEALTALIESRDIDMLQILGFKMEIKVERLREYVLSKDGTIRDRILPKAGREDFVHLTANVYLGRGLESMLIEGATPVENEVQCPSDADLLATLVIVKTSPIHGHGVFAAYEIRSRRQILEILGEVFRKDSDEARDRDESVFIYRMTGEVRAARATAARATRAERSDAVDLYLDPQHKGSIGRWINSSCEPNCIVEQMTDSRGLPRLILIAKRDIKAGEELCVSYGEPYFGSSLACNCQKKACKMKGRSARKGGSGSDSEGGSDRESESGIGTTDKSNVDDEATVPAEKLPVGECE